MTIMMIKQFIIATALSAGINPQVALSVASVESNFRHDVVSTTNDYGIFQLNERYFTRASQMTTKQNIIHGIKHLAFSKRYCKINAPLVVANYNLLWVNCYNLGVSGVKKIKEQWEYGYFQKVMKEYEIQNKKVHNSMRSRNWK